MSDDDPGDEPKTATEREAKARGFTDEQIAEMKANAKRYTASLMQVVAAKMRLN